MIDFILKGLLWCVTFKHEPLAGSLIIKHYHHSCDTWTCVLPPPLHLYYSPPWSYSIGFFGRTHYFPRISSLISRWAHLVKLAPKRLLTCAPFHPHRLHLIPPGRFLSRLLGMLAAEPLLRVTSLRAVVSFWLKALSLGRVLSRPVKDHNSSRFTGH